MSPAVSKIDSNVVGLRFAEEATIGVLPGTPVWNPLEPNSYGDFGGSVTTLARNPINPSRQRKKGVLTDLEAAGGFNIDLTQDNLQELLQGFFFATLRKKDEHVCETIVTATDDFEPSEVRAVSAVIAAGGTTYVRGDIVTLSGGTFGTAATFLVTEVAAGVVVTVSMYTPGDYSVLPGNPVSTTGAGANDCTLTLTWEDGSAYLAGDLLFAKGFDDDANNGLHVVSAGNTFAVTVTSNLVDALAQTGQITRVGFAFSDAEIDATGTLPTLDSAAKDLTTLGLMVGEWIFIGGDATANQFGTAADNGFARIRSISANSIELDKSSNTLVTDGGGGKTIHVFWGRVLKNESSAALIKRRTYNLERQLGAPDSDFPAVMQSEYLTGAIPSELTLNIPTADKVMADISFMATDSEQRSAVTGVKSGTRPDLEEAEAFNTSSDVARIKMAVVSSSDSNPDPLFAYLTELTLNLNNNISLNKAVGVLGAIDGSAGNFEIGGSVTAYFADTTSVESVRANADITIDAHIVKANQGITIDVPLITLGDGRPNVEQDTAIMLPFEMEASSGAKIDTDLNHTLLMVFWDYLPDLA